MKKHIIIDCDTGIDDAIAIICGHLCKEIDVVAITTVGGNADLEHTYANTLNLVDEIGWNVEVVKGIEKPLARDLITAPHINGKTGLGDVGLRKSTKDICDEDIRDYIYRKAREYDGKLEILLLGPMTNIASTILKYPDIKEKIKGITFMGGSLSGGNISPVAEFNIYVDPEAANIVLKSGIPLTMVGLDVTEQAILAEEDRQNFEKFNNPHSSLTVKLLDFMVDRSRRFGIEGAMIHDGLALASMVLPGLLENHPYYAMVETQGSITSGMVVVDRRKFAKGKENVNIALKVDVDMFKEWIKDLICY